MKTKRAFDVKIKAHANEDCTPTFPCQCMAIRSVGKGQQREAGGRVTKTERARAEGRKMDTRTRNGHKAPEVQVETTSLKTKLSESEKRDICS